MRICCTRTLRRGATHWAPTILLLISAGLLVGTMASASARTHVMAKSPLTNLLGSANMGGFFAPEMRWAGFDHLVIKGRAEKPVYLFIHDGEIEIRSAQNVWGSGVYDSQEIIRRRTRRPGERRCCASGRPVKTWCGLPTS